MIQSSNVQRALIAIEQALRAIDAIGGESSETYRLVQRAETDLVMASEALAQALAQLARRTSDRFAA